MSTGRRGGKMGRPQGARYTRMVRFLATPEMAEYIFSRGGAAYLRRLVDEDRQRQEGGAWPGDADIESRREADS